MKLLPNSKFLIIGDSVGDFGRAYPVGEGLHAGLGTGFPRNLDSLFRLEAPKARIRVMNVCTSGNTSKDLLDRWQTDVLDNTPDYVLVQIGINDVWRHFDEPFRSEIFISEKQYAKNLETMADLTLPRVRGMYFMSPYVMELNTKDPFRAMMDRYRKAMQKVAAAKGAVFIDLQKEFDAYFKNFHPTSMNWDRIHPDPTGHLLIARTIARAVELL